MASTLLTWKEWTGQSRYTLDDLRCPECGKPVFVSTISEPGMVMCRQFGHWVGMWHEAVSDPLIAWYFPDIFSVAATNESPVSL